MHDDGIQEVLTAVIKSGTINAAQANIIAEAIYARNRYILKLEQDIKNLVNYPYEQLDSKGKQDE